MFIHANSKKYGCIFAADLIFELFFFAVHINKMEISQNILLIRCIFFEGP